MRHRLIGPVLLLLLLCASCAPLATYGKDRVRDLSDVVDVRYGTGFGLGASVQFLECIGTGLGCSVEWYQRQWYGRKSIESRDGLFADALIIGFDGDHVRRVDPGEGVIGGDTLTGPRSILLYRQSGGHADEVRGTEEWFTQPGGKLPGMSTGRIGGAVFLPGVLGGLYLNLGEVLDFFGGLATFDLMNDDGQPKFSRPAAPVATS
jgi:hypothetical protein